MHTSARNESCFKENNYNKTSDKCIAKFYFTSASVPPFVREIRSVLPYILKCLTVYLEGVDHFDVPWCRFTEHREHVQEVIESHVTVTVLREHLTYPLSEWVLLKINISIFFLNYYCPYLFYLV